MKIFLYGAKSIALGAYRAIRYLYPQHTYMGFVVSNRINNPRMLDGLKVWEFSEILKCYETNERHNLHIIIATQEDVQQEIASNLLKNGFSNYACLDSYSESRLMAQYFAENKRFLLLRAFSIGTISADIQVFVAKFHKDRPLRESYKCSKWMQPIQVGSVLTDSNICELKDDEGESISHKNVNYCELTALYWIWKNKLELNCEDSYSDYYGLHHYRRFLDISEEDLYRLSENDIDVILPLPTIHAPNMSEHHTRYLKDDDWDAMVEALAELQPEYALAFKEIVTQQYMYNYNIIIAKGYVLREYCEWLFPILERTEELSVPCGSERADRYIGYLGENLLTLYFMYNRNDLKIVHTGRIMLT